MLVILEGMWWLMAHHGWCPRYFWAITTNMVALTLALSTAQRSGKQHHVRRTWEQNESCTSSARNSDVLMNYNSRTRYIKILPFISANNDVWQFNVNICEHIPIGWYSGARGLFEASSILPSTFDHWDNWQMHGSWEMYKPQFDGGFC
jgi:hypothetical protein